MANAKAKKNYRDRIVGMGKRELNALHKEMRNYYAKHKWRNTVSAYKIAPTDLSPIVDPDGKRAAEKAAKKKARPKKKAKPKKKGKPGRPKKKDAAPKKKAKPKKKAPKKKGKPGRPKKKDSAPKKKGKTGRPKKASKKKSKRAAKKPAPKKVATSEDEMVLDYLLKRRKGRDSWKPGETIDEVVLDLIALIRGV